MRSHHFVRWSIGVFGALSLVLSVGPPAARSQTIETLKERMAAIQEDLDETTARLEALRDDEGELTLRIQELDSRIEEIGEDNAELQDRAIQRARSLYMGGSSGMLEALLSARDIGELSAELEYATHVSDSDTLLFLRYSRVADELRAARAEAEERSRELAEVRESLTGASADLQDRFVAAQDEYEALKKKLAEEAAAAAAASSASTGSQSSAPQPSANAAPPPITDGMTCPVDGPNSFIDSWGYPRSGGRTHEGTDIMAADGTSVVAITDGTITYAGYGDSAGNWLILSGTDGNAYWYLHNRQNLVSGGRVSVGQQIATVGSTGNASGGAPHVHFEYHPGGGGPVNPYPMLRGLC